MLCYHPHGVLCAGFSWNGTNAEKLTSKAISFLVVGYLKVAPLFGYQINWMGNIHSASSSEMKKRMEKGQNIALLPGGFEEATIMKRGAERIYLRNRKGFIKYALRYGYRVHPVYTFGENDTYSTFHWFAKARIALNRFKIPAVAFWGSWLIPIIPRSDISLHTVVGEAVVFPKISDPTSEDVDKWHAAYMTALTEHFDAQKGAAGKGDAQLEIW